MDAMNLLNPRAKSDRPVQGTSETLPAGQPLPAYVMPVTMILLWSISEVSCSRIGEGTASATQRPRTMAGTVNLMMNARAVFARIPKRGIRKGIVECR